MLCYVILYFVMLSSITLCCVILSYTMLWCVMLCCRMSWYAMLCYVTLCDRCTSKGQVIGWFACVNYCLAHSADFILLPFLTIDILAAVSAQPKKAEIKTQAGA